MMATTFHGHREFVDRLDDAVRASSVEGTTAAVQSTLEEMIGGGQLRLPEALRQASDQSYARRLLYRSEEHGYTVIAMVWGPGQGTALHDHDGTWCVEGVVEGEILVTPYELLEHQGDRWHFEPFDTIHSHVGSAGSLIPPSEYHTIKNASSEVSAVTIHVYGRELHQCTVFEAAQSGWYQQQIRELWYN